jgi:sortase B
MKRIKERLLSALPLLVILFAAVIYTVHDQSVRAQSEQIYEAMREQPQAEEAVGDTELAAEKSADISVETETETELTTESVVTCDPVYDFDELRAQNPDIYAWILVPGTQVDYPVLQSETDNYYLDYNIDGSKGYPGCIYSNACNTRNFSDFITVLYGHNMKNGSMFGCLHSFEDVAFFDENDTILVYTPENRLTYEIEAAIKFTDEYIPAYYDIRTWDGAQEFLNALSEYTEETGSHVREGVRLDAFEKNARLLTLSTCVSGERSRRYLIVGRLVETAYYE